MKSKNDFFVLLVIGFLCFSCENKLTSNEIKDSIKESTLTNEPKKDVILNDSFKELNAIDKEYTDCFSSSEQMEQDDLNCKSENSKLWDSYIKKELSKLGKSESKEVAELSTQISTLFSDYVKNENEFIQLQFNEDQQDLMYQGYMVDEMLYINRSYSLLLNEAITNADKAKSELSSAIAPDLLISQRCFKDLNSDSKGIKKLSSKVDSLESLLIGKVSPDDYQYHSMANDSRKNLDEAILRLSGYVADSLKLDSGKKNEFKDRVNFAFRLSRLILREKYNVNR